MRDPDIHHAVFTARHEVEQAVLHLILARFYARESDPHADASEEHAEEGVALAARNLVHAIEQLPAMERPIGWDAHSFGPFSTEPAVTA